jgi:hypothetical protein
LNIKRVFYKTLVKLRYFSFVCLKESKHDELMVVKSNLDGGLYVAVLKESDGRFLLSGLSTGSAYRLRNADTVFKTERSQSFAGLENQTVLLLSSKEVIENFLYDRVNFLYSDYIYKM